ncbi:K-box region [Musa troglodytarum]|uniref:K-box region n=1 Tax=Musa troglodytarum TaxID=320322 RepID=A0A9E7EV57_9LILI|nr:K-box region [Musa troglodytarum]
MSLQSTIERYRERTKEDTSSTTMEQDAKYHLIGEQIAEHKEKFDHNIQVSSLEKGNASLREKVNQLCRLPSTVAEEVPSPSTRGQHAEADTELRIGRPGMENHDK